MLFESHLNRQAIPEILALQPRARDNIFLSDCGGLARELANRNCAEASYLNGLRQGDLARVGESEKFLEELTNIVPQSRTFVNTANVVGSLPIVPAFLAGQPQNMRQRTRQKRPAGPLAIFLESTCSSGAAASANMRGAVLLALVRLLSNYRPVELWICTTYGQREHMNGLLTRIETRPMDLARATHLLANLSETAVAGARLFNSMNLRITFGWSYGVPELERKWCEEIFSRFLQPGSDVLYVPAAYLADKQLAQPVAWLKDMLVRYGGETVRTDEAEAAEG